MNGAERKEDGMNGGDLNAEQNKEELRRRAESLARRLTTEEKIGMVHGAQLFRTKGVERLGIPPLKMSDGPMGVRQEFEPDSWRPLGLTDDYVTYLPCNSALASTWNRELAFEMGSVLGEEARGRGKDVILAPGVNIKRSPLCGRNFEYFSEDPYLTKELAVPFIRGVQQWDVAACVKHFAVNNQETRRTSVEAEVDEETLREIYLPAFHDALIKAGSLTVMGAYNKLYGEFCCQSTYLLDKLLREEWDYDGAVISDWGAVHDTDLAAASQITVEMSVTNNFDEYYMARPLLQKIKSGEIPESRLDEKVICILMLMLRLHMLDGKRKTGTYNTPEHRRTALEAARESVVLLKNEKGRLPLSPDKITKLLVVGDNAERLHSNGGGSAEIKALYEISPLMGIRTLLGGNVQVDFVRGYCRGEEPEAGETSGENWQADSLGDMGKPDPGEALDKRTADRRTALRQEALEAARTGDYDQVLFVGGLNHGQDSEGGDRRDMKLPYGQEELIGELLDINPETVVALLGGSPVEMGGFLSKADAVVWGWYAGMEGGRALAEVLFGRVNPSGKLPETFYKRLEDCSAHSLGEFPGQERVRYGEGIFVGYRYNDTFQVEPEFCFGHGLSYTTFDYGEGTLEWKDGSCTVCVSVANTGIREGKEIIQVYVEDGRKGRPLKALKGFGKINLKPGETSKAEIPIEDCPEGRRVLVGSSLHDIRLAGSARHGELTRLHKPSPR